ncbi:MAG: hypothetical protein EB103_00250 [Actinobacteria bacterium]|nr:hypothetical protein [Actinomycetota bacterium]
MSNFRKLSAPDAKVSGMKAKRFLVLLASFSLTASFSVATSSSSSSAVVLSEQSYADKPVVGLVIQYQDFVAAKDWRGDLVGISSISGEISQSADLGLGMWSVRFKRAKSELTALALAAKLKADSRIKRIYLDHQLTSKNTISTPKLGILRASAAPSRLQATDAWSAAAALVPKIRLTWSAPTRLNGGLIWGYRVSQYDAASKTWKVLVSNTKSKLTSLTVTKNLVAGEFAKFKVAAVTKNSTGKLMAVSSYSSIVSFKPTTAPKAPILQSSGQITSANPTVSWLSQTTQQKGGLATSYTVLATAPDSPSLSCTSSGTSCMLSGLQSQVKYSVVVTATNAKGSASSNPVSETEDPMFSEQWYLTSEFGINIEPAWNITKGNPSVVVAVLDSGITRHPDLDENVVAGYDFILSDSNARDFQPGRDADPTDPGDYSTTGGRDSTWHGTHVAGIIAASANSIGITGVAPMVKISPIRVLGVNGGSESDIAAGINWAIGVPISGVPTNQNVAKVINLSIGSKVFSTCSKSSPTQLAIDASKLRNVTIVTSAGNDDKNARESYPGNCTGNITIGATGYYGDRTTYSNHSYFDARYSAYIGVDISAPGGDEWADSNLPADGGILSTWNSGARTASDPTYASEVGTSMASPIAAGVLALMYSVKPNLTEDQAWDILRTTAKSFAPGSTCQDLRTTVELTDGTPYETGFCGAGIIDAGAALEAVLNLK